MRQRILARSTRPRNEILLSGFESQYLVGAASPGGHSISNVSFGRPAALRPGAVRTRRRAKRELSGAVAPGNGAPGMLRQRERQFLGADAPFRSFYGAHF